ncbi:MAG TPA: ABC transporter substrate-binding protein [Geobacterales bacterium]|nr:ABC transporter substrate-binding protein [Geobacterales bacterium]
MSAPIGDDKHSDYSKYAPKRLREQPPLPAAERPYVTSAPTVPSPTPMHQDRRATAEFASWPEPIPEPPPQLLEDTNVALIGRIAVVVTFAAAVALLLIFAKPLWQDARALFNADAQRLQGAKSDRLTAYRPLVPATGTAAVSGAEPPASAQAQQAPLSPISHPLGQEPAAPSASLQVQQTPLSPTSHPLGQEQRSVNSPIRGVTDTEIRFGISAPFSGPARELGQNMKLGIEAAFNVANASGGVHGRQLRLIAADDGYEPTRTAETLKRLYERDQVFGLVGNVGTPTAAVAVPYALEHKMLFFGAFTGAGLLRSDPPDRYVFNYRASYAEETEAIVHYLVKVRRLKPEEIAVFAQQDSYGDAGYAGVAKAIRSLPEGDESTILRLNYTRNTVDVDEAVAQLRKKRRIPIKAVIMVPTYRAAAKFIEKTRDLYPDMIYTSVSFVGSTALAGELMLLGKRYATGVIVTQVVPAVDGHSSLVLDYKSALAKYFPGEAPDYVSLEGYVTANVLIEALKRSGRQLDAERLVETLENLHDFDIGLGTPLTFGRSEHQGVHKVWGSQLDATGHYQPIDLQ